MKQAAPTGITRQVVNTEGGFDSFTFTFDPGTPVGIARTLSDMMKWDLEVDRKIHGQTARKFKASDYKRMTSLYEVKVPTICHPNTKCSCKFDPKGWG
jgi:hypothetical protein